MVDRLSVWSGVLLVATAALLIGFVTPASAADEVSVAAMMARSELSAADGSLETAIGHAIRAADEAQRAKLEAELVSVALDAGQSYDQRAMACRLIALCDGRAGLQLAPLLRDETYAQLARFVIERMPNSAADRALLAALPEVNGALKLGVINSLAMRRSADAVPDLAALAASDDAPMAAAAIKALGAIGTSRSLDALVGLEVPGVLRHVRAEAILTAAQHVLAGGQGSRSTLRAVEPLSQAGQPPSIRAAAFRLLVGARPQAAAEWVTEWLQSDDVFMQKTAAGAFDLLPGPSAQRAIVQRADSLSPRVQALLVGGLASRGSDLVLPLARKSLESADASLQRVAIETVGRFGSVADVPVLLKLAGKPDNAADVALQALTRLPDDAVDEVLQEEFARADSPVRVQLPKIFVERHVKTVVPTLMELTSDAELERRLRSASYNAIGELADFEVVPALYERMDADRPDRTEIERTLVAIGRRLPDGRVIGWLQSHWADGGETVRDSIIRMAGAIGDKTSLDFLVPLAQGPDRNQDAFRAITTWTSPEALPVLEGWINESQLDVETRQTVWRALFRLATRLTRNERDEGIPWLGKSLSLAAAGDDRRSVIEVLGDTPEEASLAILDEWDDQPELTEAITAARESIHGRRDLTPGR